jgi:hypothetical protein
MPITTAAIMNNGLVKIALPTVKIVFPSDFRDFIAPLNVIFFAAAANATAFPCIALKSKSSILVLLPYHLLLLIYPPKH